MLAADPGVEVQVSLVWGPNAADRQKVRITGIARAYGKFPLAFSGGADTTDGALEIVATGSGSLHIGAVSLMPADNVNGFRAEGALRALSGHDCGLCIMHMQGEPRSMQAAVAHMSMTRN